ncbi:MAG: DUF4249 family protein [Prolixibacteraceae bacterium]|jgi:hypothetical protein|nr:DUF4249 family protein [Prolixibacteraceae bacterium]
MKKLSIYLFLFQILYACVADIDIESTRDKKIVVNCVLTPDSIQTLTLMYSSPHSQLWHEEVDSAIITLFQDSIEIGHFRKTGFSNWQLLHTPQYGDKYRIHIKVPNWPDIEGSTTMPNPVHITKTEGNNSNTVRYFRQLPNTLPYWIFVIRQKHDTIMVKPQIASNDVLLTSIGCNHPNADNFNTTNNMVLENKGSTREHIAYIRITAPKDSTETTFYVETNLYQSLVFFRAASTEYDLYMKSSIQKMVIHSSFNDPTAWFDESEIFTNIDNGLGIFGAFSDVIVQCHYALDNTGN